VSFISRSSPMRRALLHFEECHPNEGVGVFVNSGLAGAKDEFIPLRNSTGGDPLHEFEVDVDELFEALDLFATANGVNPGYFIKTNVFGQWRMSQNREVGDSEPRIVSIIHSHPSGVVGPSKADIEMLESLKPFGVARGWVLARIENDETRWTVGALSSFGAEGERTRFEGGLR